MFKSTCRMCHGVCGVLVHVQDGRVVKVAGDRERPSSRGYICPKGTSSVEYTYHPDRLSDAREKHGAESVVLSRGTGRPYRAFNVRFTNTFSTPNQWGSAHICYHARVQASKLTCGQLPICGFGGVYPGAIMV